MLLKKKVWLIVWKIRYLTPPLSFVIHWLRMYWVVALFFMGFCLCTSFGVLSVSVEWTRICWWTDMDLSFKSLLHVHLPGHTITLTVCWPPLPPSVPPHPLQRCVRMLICVSFTGRWSAVHVFSVFEVTMLASGHWSRSLLSSLQRYTNQHPGICSTTVFWYFFYGVEREFFPLLEPQP